MSSASTLGSSSNMVMFGQTSGVTISATASSNTPSITLTRLGSKVTFNITPATGITITGYQLCHVPMSSYINNATDSTHFNPSATYGDFTSVSGLSSTTQVSPYYYMYENLVGRKSGATSFFSRSKSNAPTDVRVRCLPNIGDYYYSDGTFGASASPTGKTAIGLVFSNAISATDSVKGWTHGYAMALTNAASAVIWSSNSTAEFGETSGTFTNTLTLMKSDMDGYNHCQTIKNKSGYSSTTYPAFYYALNYGTSSIGGTKYAAPSSSSGWYLPSEGQWYMIIKNLGGITRVFDIDNTTVGTWTNNASITAATAINTYLNAVSGETINWSSTTSIAFWSSSESSASNVWGTGSDYGNLNFGNTAKSYTSPNYRVRPALAF